MKRQISIAVVSWEFRGKVTGVAAEVCHLCFTLRVRRLRNKIITVLVAEELQSSVWAHHSHLK